MLIAKIILGIGTISGILLYKKTNPLFLKIILIGFLFSYLLGYYVVWPIGTVSFLLFGVFVLTFMIWCGIKRKWLQAIISLFVIVSFVFILENYPYANEMKLLMILPILIQLWIFWNWRKHVKELSILIILFAYELTELLSFIIQ